MSMPAAIPAEVTREPLVEQNIIAATRAGQGSNALVGKRFTAPLAVQSAELIDYESWVYLYEAPTG